MARNERSGRAKIPQWWLDKVLPMLNDRSIRLADVAEAASRHAGRKSAWGRDAISKFATGIGQTVELANGISAALHVPQPFFTAPSETAASAMALIVEREREPPYDDYDRRNLAAYDSSHAREMKSVGSGMSHSAAVGSSDGEEGARGKRSGRPGRGRS